MSFKNMKIDEQIKGFEAFVNNPIITLKNLDPTSNKTYQEPITEFAWKAWFASANRDGYKLVPVEPTEVMLEASLYRQWDDLSSPLENMDALRYKAMIGAAE